MERSLSWVLNSRWEIPVLSKAPRGMTVIIYETYLSAELLDRTLIPKGFNMNSPEGAQ
jgi:hypothetical protein